MNKVITLAIFTALTPIMHGAADQEQPQPEASVASTSTESAQKQTILPKKIISLTSLVVWQLIAKELAKGNTALLESYEALAAGLNDIFGRTIQLEAKHLSEIAEVFYLNIEPEGRQANLRRIDINHMPKWLIHNYFCGVSLQDLIDNKLLFTSPDSEGFPHFQGRQLKDLTGLQNLPNIKQYRTLKIEPRNHLTHIDPEDFKECDQLVELHLSWNRIDKLQAGAFKYLTNLKHLRLSQGNPLIEIEPGSE